MYSDNISHVRVGTQLTPSFPCEIGVRQGDSLSPTLFNIYVDDITDFLNCDVCEPAKIGNVKVGCMFYADDLVILSESQTGLQTSLNKLNDYCNKWHLKVNKTKTKVMVTQASRNVKTVNLSFDN